MTAKEEFIEMIKEYEVDTVVSGLPLMLDGPYRRKIMKNLY